jgi:hypothetical protein
MGKRIEKGQTSDCNQSNTPLQYEGEDKALQHLNKGLAGCKTTTRQTRLKIAYKLGVRYELVFSVGCNG